MAERNPPLTESATAAGASGAAIGEIATFIAHELRNVLQVITTSSYAARQGDLAQLANIERNALRAQQIVSDLLALAGGRVATTASRVSEAVTVARQDLEVDRVNWVDELADDAVDLHVGLFARLLHVLYENAIQMSESQAGRTAPVTITTSSKVVGSSLVVTVCDDGPGIPAHVRGDLFEPLVTARERGTGLGLALAKRICEAHGGTIGVAGAHEGAGACFEVRVPLAAR